MKEAPDNLLGDATVNTDAVPKKERRAMTAVRKYGVVRDAVAAAALNETDPIARLLESLKDEALAEALG